MHNHIHTDKESLDCYVFKMLVNVWVVVVVVPVCGGESVQIKRREKKAS